MGLVWQRMKCSDTGERVECEVVVLVGESPCKWWGFGVFKTFKTHASNPDDGSVSQVSKDSLGLDAVANTRLPTCCSTYARLRLQHTTCIPRFTILSLVSMG